MRRSVAAWFLLALLALVGLAWFAAGRVADAIDFGRDRAVAEEARGWLAQTADAPLADVAGLSGRFRAVSAAVEPSVVDIVTLRAAPRGAGPVAAGNGSGVIVEVDAGGGRGYVVTNNHVVAGATDLEVTLSDGRRTSAARVLGTDPRTDLAVVEIAADGLVAAEWGDSDTLAKGDWVLAFGSPFGYVGSMTAGIVSATGRSTADRSRGRVGILGPGGYEDFIQTDAAINPGNSGGPLVDTAGRVVGINSAIASRSGGFDGIGFAIPSDMARAVYAQLRRAGRVTRGWLGIQILGPDDPELPAADRRALVGRGGGAVVAGVIRGTPAAEALRAGDVIVAVEGHPIAGANELRNRIAYVEPGTAVTLRVLRGGGELDVPVTLGEQPDGQLNLRAPVRR